MKFDVEYWVDDWGWCYIDSFDSREDARDFIKLESERDEYMTRTTGMCHIVEYRIVEVKSA